MVNPSTADATENDATIRKLLGFGERHGWGKLIVGNLFAYRATDVRELGRVSDPFGEGNGSHLIRIFEEAQHVIFAWGPLAKQPRYFRHIWRVANAYALEAGHTPLCIGPPAKDGHPKHPLMLAYSEPIAEWIVPQK
jgi:hypothetical protein